MIFGVCAEAEHTAAGTRPLEVAGVDACLTDRPPGIHAERFCGVDHRRTDQHAEGVTLNPRHTRPGEGPSDAPRRPSGGWARGGVPTRRCRRHLSMEPRALRRACPGPGVT